MKKVLFASLVAVAFPAFAEPAACSEYHQKMEEVLKAEGNYSPEAMKIVTDQTAAIPAEQQEAFCKAGLEGLTIQASESDPEKKG